MTKSSHYTATSEHELPRIPVNENTDKIFHEAWSMFQQLGFRGTTVDELCLRCELTKPTLYYYFGNKEMLFIQVLMQQLQGFGSILAAEQPLDKRLTALTHAIFAAFSTDIDSMMRDLEHVKDPTLHDAMNQAFRRELFDPLTETMRDGMVRGTLRPGDPAFYARIFLGLVNTFVRRRARAAGPPFDNDLQLLAPQLVDFFFVGAYHPIRREEQ